MKVEIWSDIMCPFCYLGKHHYEAALSEFPDRRYVETVWKSFQLDPGIPRHAPATDTYTYLSERKGFSVDQARQMTGNLAETAGREGIVMNFDKTVVANTFDAHRLIHLAQSKGLGSEAEESLFKAHFEEGEDVSAPGTLAGLGESLGLKRDEVSEALDSGQYTEEVNSDIREAVHLGVRGVPFFVFNRKYAVSGAQPKDVFLKTLERAFSEWRAEQPESAFQTVAEGPVCDPETGCD
ncbi:MAG: disulfide bond formation protein DsbA [Cytophagaceae bacterium SCN 52-12]|nr:MAG: disulfide bond formation protein DsbA [Cytophagaceae bacterium SCN 52-12]